VKQDELIERLRAAIVEAGSQSAFAELHGLSTAYVNDVLNRRREPGPAILEALGIEKVVTYEEKRGAR
jgi:DNA-binding transcriptional regulator YdaS (Cro superfamily)